MRTSRALIIAPKHYYQASGYLFRFAGGRIESFRNAAQPASAFGSLDTTPRGCEAPAADGRTGKITRDGR